MKNQLKSFFDIKKVILVLINQFYLLSHDSLETTEASYDSDFLYQMKKTERIIITPFDLDNSIIS